MVYADEWRGRNRWLLGGVVALVVMSAGFFLGRLSNDHAQAAPETRIAPGPTVAVPAPRASSTPASAGPSSSAGGGSSGSSGGAASGQIAGAPGRRNSLGVPVGYPRSQEGAVSACANYVSAYADVHNREPGRIQALFRSIAVPSKATKLADAILSLDKKNAQGYGISSLESPQMGFDLRVAGYQTRAYSPDAATVVVWSTVGIGLYGSTDDIRQIRQVWGTDLCSVAWSGGDWRLTAAGDGPSGPAITDRAAEDMSRFVYVGGPAT